MLIRHQFNNEENNKIILDFNVIILFGKKEGKWN